jgi:hypothetical protein
MRIIDPTPHKSVEKETVCRNCGVTLAYVPNDVKSETHCDYGGGSDTYRHVMCPSCNHKTGVK